MKKVITFARVDLGEPLSRQLFIDLSREYFDWMNQEIIQLCGFSIPSIVNKNLSDYVLYTVDIASRIKLSEGGIYFLRDTENNVVTMGGLRRLPNANAEIVRIYTNPQYRGNGYATVMLQNLIEEAGRLSYSEVYLDTGDFMKTAQKLYEASGFTQTPPYPGAEPPKELIPYWLYMKRIL